MLREGNRNIAASQLSFAEESVPDKGRHSDSASPLPFTGEGPGERAATTFKPKPQHPRAFPGIFAPEAAPVLDFHFTNINLP